MLVGMYRIRSLDGKKTSEIEESLKSVQAKFRNLPGCCGLRVLADVDDPGVFISVSYWNEADTNIQAGIINSAIDTALAKFSLEKHSETYRIIQEL